METYLNALRERLNTYKQKCGYTHFREYDVSISSGPRYTKVFSVAIQHDGTQQKSIISFIDNSTGDILKPASFNAPAKGVRGKINSPQNGMEAHMDNGSVVYLR